MSDLKVRPLVAIWTLSGGHMELELNRNSLPAFLLAEFGDVGGVVFAVPLVNEQQPIDGALAMLGVDERPGEVLGFQGAPETVPAIVQGVEKGLRNRDWSGFGVDELCPAGFFVRADGGLVFGERQAQADVGVHVAVRDVMDDLADG